MNAQTQVVTNDQTKLSGELDVLKPQLEKVLPAHVSADKFMRVVMTAIAQSPDLRRADRASLLTSCVKCATDGLLPDGREAALVIFNTKAKVKEIRDGKEIEIERWIDKVQYMPMVGGILKKVRNSGELLSISSNVAHEKDTFKFWTDDFGEHITFEPNLKEVDRGGILCAFAIAKTKNGGVYMEVMTRHQIEQVKAVSKSGDKGPWGKWYSEMARKSVIRRLSKRLPMSTDLEAVIHADDELYEVGQQQQRVGGKSGTAAAKALLGLPVLPDADDVAAASEGETVDTETGEVMDPKPEPLPGFDPAKAEKEIRASKTQKDFVNKLTEVKRLLNGAEMPLNVEAACDEMTDKFVAEAK